MTPSRLRQSLAATLGTGLALLMAASCTEPIGPEPVGRLDVPLGAAERRCDPLEGRFSSVVLPPSRCAVAPPLICTEGRLRGDLHGTFTFVMTAGTELPPISFFTGESDIRTREGALFGTDMGNIDLSNGNLVTHIGVTGGTDDYAGATGRILAFGVIDLAAGETSGRYVGDLCVDDEDDEDDDEDDDEH